MVINEDYFKDIEITDDDIRDDHDSHIPQEQDIATLDQHLKSHYEHCIIFSTKYMSDLEKPDSKIWIFTVPKILKNIEYIFNIYNIEYEYIIRDNSEGNINMKYWNIKNYNILSSYKIKNSDALFFGNSLNIYFYVKFPNFNYKESYYFVNRLFTVTILQNHISDTFKWIMFTKKPISLCKEYIMTDDVAFDLAEHDNERITDKLPYKIFFYKAIQFFHNTSRDKKKIKNMLKMIEYGIDPFSTK